MVPSTLYNEFLILKNRYSKIEFLINFILQKQETKIILFLNTYAGVDFYNKLFNNWPLLSKKIQISAIHGNLK